MMRKLLVIAVLALLVSLVPLGNSSVSAAATLVVDDDGMASTTDCNAITPAYPTISAAVAAANPGDTIKVCPGLYLEQVFIGTNASAVVLNNLTLLGAQAGVDARTRPFLPDPTTQSIIDHPCGPVQIAANNVTLDGFTVQGSTLPDPCFLSGIWTASGETTGATHGSVCTKQ